MNIWRNPKSQQVSRGNYIFQIMEENHQKKNELQSRREFFKEAAKRALPVVALILTPSFFASCEKDFYTKGRSICEECTGSCGNNCSGSCGSSCSSDCTNGCKGACSAACTATCTGSCKGSCSSSCKTTCKTTCTSSCRSNCYNHVR